MEFAPAYILSVARALPPSYGAGVFPDLVAQTGP